MSDLPSVSIVIPAYNASAFLPDTLDSVLSQTLGPKEIVLVDDGSTDGTSEVVQAYAGSVHYVRQKNRGVAAARNRGLAEATGDAVCFLDADDWLYPDNLRLKAEVLGREADVGLVHGWVEVTGPDLQPTGRILKGAAGEILPDLLRLIPPAIPCPSNAVIRRELVTAAGGFDEHLGTSADFDLWLRLAQRTQVARVDEVLMKYRRHEEAMFHDLKAQLRDMEHIFRKHRAELGHRQEWELLRWRFYRSIAGAYWHQGRFLKVPGPLVKGLMTGGWRRREGR